MRRLHDESDPYVYSWTRKKLQDFDRLRKEKSLLKEKEFEKFV